MTTPAVSVILPTLNRAALLPRAIASVLRQTFADLELIVVDDGSGDDTREVVAAFADPRVVYVRNGQPTGDAAARNRGIAQARAPWLAFQDSDDEWVAHSLAHRMQLAARAAPRHAAVAGALLRVTPERVELIEWPRANPDEREGEVDVGRFVGDLRAYLQSMLIRRSALDALGGFDSALKARSDVDFCLRLVRRHGVLATAEVLAVSHETGGGLSLDPAARRADLQLLLERHADLLARDRGAHARRLYDLARAEVALDRRGAGLHAASRSLRLDPRSLRSWVLLAVAPFGAAGLRRVAGARRRLERRS